MSRLPNSQISPNLHQREAFSGVQALTPLPKWGFKLYIIIGDSDPITSTEMCCADAFWWYSHIIERVKKPQTVIFPAGRQTVLPFHKENLTTRSGFAGSEGLNQSWSWGHQKFHKATAHVASCQHLGEKNASFTWSNSCRNTNEYLSLWGGKKVEEAKKGRHLFVSQPEPVPSVETETRRRWCHMVEL